MDIYIFELKDSTQAAVFLSFGFPLILTIMVLELVQEFQLNPKDLTFSVWKEKDFNIKH
jgi:hypothetical protein